MRGNIRTASPSRGAPGFPASLHSHRGHIVLQPVSTPIDIDEKGNLCTSRRSRNSSSAMNPVLLGRTDRTPSSLPTLISSYRNLCVYAVRPGPFHVTFPLLVLFSTAHPKPSVEREMAKLRQKTGHSRHGNINIFRNVLLLTRLSYGTSSHASYWLGLPCVAHNNFETPPFSRSRLIDAILTMIPLQ
jgi:hypothetical protein